MLSALGLRLILRTGSSAEVLPALVRETGAQAVFWNRLCEPKLRARDARVAATLRETGIETASFPEALLRSLTAVASN